MRKSLLLVYLLICDAYKLKYIEYSSTDSTV